MFNSDQLISILNSSIGLFSAFIISTFVYFNYGSDYSVFFLGYYSIFALSVAVYMNSHYSVISHKPTLLNFSELIKFGGGYFFVISCCNISITKSFGSCWVPPINNEPFATIVRGKNILKETK